MLLFFWLDQEDSSNESDKIFNVLRNIRLHLDKVLEMNQVDVINDDDEDKDACETIEYHLIECISVMCHSIKNNRDERIKNVIINNIYINKIINEVSNILYNLHRY